MRISISFICLLAMFFAFQGSTLAQEQEEAFYQKPLANGDKIVVTRKPFTPQLPSPEEQAQRAKEHPGTTLLSAKVEAAYDYSLFLVEAKSGVRSLLWQSRVAELSLGTFRESPFKIYDVVYEQNTLLVLLRASSFVMVDRVRENFPGKFQSLAAKHVLIQESDSTAPGTIISGDIVTPTDLEHPVVLLKSELGGSYRFVWRTDLNIPITVLNLDAGGSPQTIWRKEKWMPQQTEQPKQLFSKPFTLDGKKWQLTYDIDPTATTIDTFEGGRTSTRNGTRATLSKAPLSATGQAQAPETLRQSFTTFNPSASPQVWSGDVAVDEKTGKAYLAIADGSTFSLQIVSLRELNLRPPMPGMRDTRIQQQIEHQDVTIEADKTVVKELPLIDAISIKKVGEQLTVTLNGESKTQQQWIYSLATQTWQTATP